MPESFNRRKFEELVLYFAERSADDAKFGATKLNKLLCYADFFAFAEWGQSITGATYTRQKNGPVPKELPRVRDDLSAGGVIKLKKRPHFGYVQTRILPQRPADRSVFSQRELNQFEVVLQLLEEDSAQDASDRSHRDFLGWQHGEPGAVIPYESVFVSQRKPSEELIKRGQELAREHGWK